MSETESVPKPKTKTTPVTGSVTINSNTLDPRQPLMLEQASDAFKDQLAETHAGRELSNVTVALISHKIGESATYEVKGDLS